MARLGERRTVRGFWLVPVADLLASALWAAGFLGRRVQWGGRTFQVHRDGSMLALPGGAVSAPLEPARRVG
jgi:hypothetical protein